MTSQQREIRNRIIQFEQSACSLVKHYYYQNVFRYEGLVKEQNIWGQRAQLERELRESLGLSERDGQRVYGTLNNIAYVLSGMPEYHDTYRPASWGSAA